MPNDDGERATACNDAKTYPQAVGTSRLGAMLEVAICVEIGPIMLILIVGKTDIRTGFAV